MLYFLKSTSQITHIDTINTMHTATNATPALATVRLQVRASTDLHALVKRAAELQGRTMTDFVTAAVHKAVHQAIEQAETSQNNL